MKHGDSTFNEAHAALDLLGGSQGLNAVLTARGERLPEVKFGGTTLGQVEAIRNKLPEDVWEAALAGEVEFVVEDPSKVLVPLKLKPQLLVDTDGRFIFRNIPEVKQPDWSFGFNKSIQPGYAEVLERLECAFRCKLGISAAQFQDRAEAKKEEILENSLVANLFSGRHSRPFAIALPQMGVPKKGGLGRLLDSTIIPAARRSYESQYPKRAFNNYHGYTLVDNVESFPGSRQERLIAALAHGPQVIWVFLNCLQGASNNASRTLVQTFPKELSEYTLGGTLVNAPVIAAYPEIVTARGRCPLYYCAADVFQRGLSLYLYPIGDYVRFGDWRGLGDWCGHCSASRCSASVALLA